MISRHSMASSEYRSSNNVIWVPTAMHPMTLRSLTTCWWRYLATSWDSNTTNMTSCWSLWISADGRYMYYLSTSHPIAYNEIRIFHGVIRVSASSLIIWDAALYELDEYRSCNDIWISIIRWHHVKVNHNNIIWVLNILWRHAGNQHPTTLNGLLTLYYILSDYQSSNRGLRVSSMLWCHTSIDTNYIIWILNTLWSYMNTSNPIMP